MTIKTNHGLVAWAQGMLGQPYWYGTCCYPATSSLLASKTKQYPSHYQASRTARYKSDIAKGTVVADCIGLIKGYYWTREDGTQKYGLDGRPDKGANGMYTAAKVKGDIKTLPEIPGLLLYSSGHAGVYIGGGYAIEARGFNYGVVKTKVSERNWTAWYQCPYIDYLNGDVPLPVPEQPLGNRTLRYSEPMMRGEDVRLAQELLLAHGFAPGKIDGIFGVKTEAAVKAFQSHTGLEVDGIVGSKSWEALEKPPQAPTPEAQEPEKPADEPTQGALPDYGTRLLKYQKGRGYMSGDDVSAVQVRLLELGYDPGKIDGKYGPNTEAAVKLLQESAGIKVDGIVGPETRRILEA